MYILRSLVGYSLTRWGGVDDTTCNIILHSLVGYSLTRWGGVDDTTCKLLVGYSLTR